MVQYLSQVTYVFYVELPSRHSGEYRMVECGIPLADCESLAGYAWTSAE